MLPEWMTKQEATSNFTKLLVLFVIIATAGAIIGHSFPESGAVKTAQNSYGLSYDTVENVTNVEMPEYESNKVNSVLWLFLNNMVIVIIALFASIYTNNLLPYAITIANSFSIGVIIGRYTYIYDGLFVLSNVIPHSMIEVPAICLACTGGLYFYYHRNEVNFNVLLKSIVIISVFILIASIIETFITPGIATFVGIKYGVM